MGLRWHASRGEIGSRMSDSDRAGAELGFGVLGPLEASYAGVALPLGGGRQRAVLALLVCEAGHAVPVERLLQGLWGESVPPGAVTSVQTYVFHLRQVLEPGRPGDRPAASWSRCRAATGSTSTRRCVDMARFEDGVAAGDAATEAARAGPSRGRSTARHSRSGAETCSPTSRDYDFVAPVPRSPRRAARVGASSPASRPSSTWDTIWPFVGELGVLLERAPPARGPARPAHPRAVPLGPAVRRVGRLPRAAFGARHRAGHRAEPAAAGAQHPGAPAGPGARLDTARSDHSRPRAHRCGPVDRSLSQCRPAPSRVADGDSPPWPSSRSPWRSLPVAPGHLHRRGAGAVGGRACQQRSASSTRPGRVLASVPVGTNPIALASSRWRDLGGQRRRQHRLARSTRRRTRSSRRSTSVTTRGPWPSPATTCGSPTSPTGPSPASTSSPTEWWTTIRRRQRPGRHRRRTRWALGRQQRRQHHPAHRHRDRYAGRPRRRRRRSGRPGRGRHVGLGGQRPQPAR